MVDDHEPNRWVFIVAGLILVACVAALLGSWWAAREDDEAQVQAEVEALVTDVWFNMNRFDRDYWCGLWWHDRGRLEALVEDHRTQVAWYELLEVVCPPLTNT